MKISVVMQSFLGDYPGSRSHPEFKFVRAVGSFLTQHHEDKELIIVSDGCDKTQRLYESLFSHIPQIKFTWAERAGCTDRSYTVSTIESEQESGGMIMKFRGTARQQGLSMATGDLVTYLDSDDLMLQHRLSELDADWSDKGPDTTYASNPLQWVHASMLTSPKWTSRIVRGRHRDMTQYGLGPAGGFVLSMRVEPGRVTCSACALSHRRDIPARWEDSVMQWDRDGKLVSGSHEDVKFYDQLTRTGKGFRQESDSYVLCHYRGLWDV